jgi:hypothetical protein
MLIIGASARGPGGAGCDERRPGRPRSVSSRPASLTGASLQAPGDARICRRFLPGMRVVYIHEANGPAVTTEERMRKIIESTLISVDGVVGDPQGMGDGIP